MSHQTTLLTGLPRSGTTLTCCLLNQMENIVALNEPLIPGALGPSCDEAIKQIHLFAHETRESIEAGELVFSAHKDGVIPDNTMSATYGSNGLRQAVVKRGKIQIPNSTISSNFKLTIKHTSLFTSLLPQIINEFPVQAVIRNPMSLLASWNTIDVPLNRGRIPAGERFDHLLSYELDKTQDQIARQLIIMEWFFKRYDQLLADHQILRYEDIVADPLVIARSFNVGVESLKDHSKLKNRNSSYQSDSLRVMFDHLMKSGHYVWNFYSRSSVETLYSKLLEADAK